LGKKSSAQARFDTIASDAQVGLCLTSVSLEAPLGELAQARFPIQAIEAWTAAGCDEGGVLPRVLPEDTALLQYTSGSTADPKGTMISHGNLMNNLACIQSAFEATEDSVGIIWLPPYHDMGLIGGLLEPVFTGFHTELFAPTTFLLQPVKWLELISSRHGTISGGPNFAYDLCLQRIRESQRTDLDLSSWKVAFVGAEPVRQRTLERFTEAFGPCGFDPQAWYPCYGLAEATLLVSGGDRSDADLHLQCRGNSRDVSCGVAREGHELCIVDPDTLQVVPEKEIGEVWLRGESVGQGYWNKPELTEAVFRARRHDGEGPYLRTGDLGYQLNGQLYLTGRLKDLLIIRGVNHHPEDLEHSAVQAAPEILPQGVAAISVEREGGEVLVLLAESRKSSEAASIESAVRAALAEVHGLQLEALVLLRPGRLPRTSSGKIQRNLCHELLPTGCDGGRS
jgi:acyl-CoA synthetase (AMP-forming)/AMP-acid ligase II